MSVDPDKPSPAMIQVRRISHDYVQRLRVAMAMTESKLLVHLGRETVEYMAETMCEKLGIAYLPPADLPRRKSDGKPTGWARGVGLKGRPTKKVSESEPSAR